MKPQSEQMASFGNMKSGVALRPLNPDRCRHTSEFSLTRLVDAQDLHCGAGAALVPACSALMRTCRQGSRVYRGASARVNCHLYQCRYAQIAEVGTLGPLDFSVEIEVLPQ